MTYSHRSIECSGYCSEWASFWLIFHRLSLRPFRGKLQPLESPFQRFRGGMDIPLRNRPESLQVERLKTTWRYRDNSK